MTRQTFRISSIAALMVLLAGAAPGNFRDYTDNNAGPFSENTGRKSSRISHQRALPSPSAAASNINDYTHMDDQLNLDPESGQTVVLRTDQKIGLQEYVPYLIPIENLDEVAVRELRPVARRICGMEGGYAQIVVDQVKKQRFVQITCTPKQLPYVEKAIRALDRKWINTTDDGSRQVVYKAHYRNARPIDFLARKYAGGNSQVDQLDNAVVHTNTPSYSREYTRIAADVDIPAHEILVDAKFYEINRNNDLKLGLDYVNWKNDVGWDLFTLGCSRFHTNLFSGTDIFTGQPSRYITDPYTYMAKDYGYNLYLSASYYDFLAVKGKAQVLANATIQTVSGTVGRWTSLDPVSGVQVTAPSQPGRRPFITDSELDRSGLMNYIMANVGTYNADGNFVPTYTYEYLEVLSGERLLQIIADEVAWIDIDVIRARYTTDGYVHFSEDYGRYVDYESFGKVGLELEVLPVVGKESTEMFVHAVSGYIEGYTPTGKPLVAQSLVDTTVRVQDGERLLLAGLSRKEKVKQKAGMPWLSDLPVLGYLFGGETKFDRRKDILIVLETAISAGLVDAGSGQPLTEREMRELILAGRFGDMMPGSVALPPSYQQARAQVLGEEDQDVPNTKFGFEQWLLDPTLR